MGIEDNQVLLRLVIAGMDPSEVQRLAQETYGQLKAEAVQHIDALTSYMREAEAARLKLVQNSSNAQAQADADAAQAKIDAETSALSAVTKLMRQQEIEANKARGAWHGMMEDLENITTVAEGAFEIISGGWERLHAAAETIIKDTNIYNSLVGSIDQMRYATDGAVADLDLISAKNRALEKELKLTDDQFGLVASAATHYAHAVGVDAKEALDKMIDGLATGRVRTLEHAGVVVDAAEANQKWADKMGTTVDAMTTQEKLIAFQTEALEKMRLKMDETGDEVDTFALRMERGFIRAKNIVSDLAAAIGNIKMPAGLDIGDDASAEGVAFRRAQAEKKARAEAAAQAAWDAQHSDFEATNAENPNAKFAGGIADNQALADARGKMKIGENKAPKEAKNAYDDLMAKFAGKGSGGTVTQGLNPDEDLATKAAMSTIDVGGTDAMLKAADEANQAAEKQAITLAKLKGITVDAAVAYEHLAKSIGISADELTHDEKMQAIDDESKVKASELAKRLQKEEDARRAELKATKNKAGFLSIFLWGEDGPDHTYKEMDAFSQYMVDTVGQMSSIISSAAGQMTKAMGSSIAAQISGDNAHRKSIKETTHDVLEALAAQGIERAIFETAEGFASLALGPIGGASAGAHFTAAALFGGVGVGAAIAARAFNGPAQSASAPSSSVSTGASASSPSSGMSTSSTGNQGATGSRSSSSGVSDQPAAPITIVINNSMPGTEYESGRSVVKALNALQIYQGSSIQHLLPVA